MINLVVREGEAHILIFKEEVPTVSRSGGLS